MIMLITPSPCADKCAAALHKATGQQIKRFSSAHAAIAALRQAEYSAVVLDETLTDSDPFAAETVLGHAGTALPVQVNLAIHSMERVEREVKTALRRREAEHLSAMKAASAALRSELKSAITGILLSSELALTVPALPPAAELKIRFVRELARSIRQQLETAA